MRLQAIIEAASMTGPAKNLLDFARTARPLGVDVIITPITRGGACTTFTEAARQSGVQIEPVREARAFDRDIVAALQANVLRVRPDILQTHAVKSHFLTRWAGLTVSEPRRLPWVAFHHGYTHSAAREHLYNQLDRWSLRAADKVITVSIPFRDQLIRRGVRPDRIEIIHNAIAPDWGCAERTSATDLRSRLGILPGRAVLLSVGRLSREKDHLTLLRAVRQLPADLQPTVLIIGDGPERKKIERAISRFSVTKAVILTGQQASAAPYYAIAQALVISSRSEGSPNALLEAMASGIPVIATRVGGIPEHVEDEKSALLVPPGNPAAMSAAIARVIGPDRALADRLRSRSQEVIRARHSPEARARKLLEIYRSVLDGRARRSGV